MGRIGKIENGFPLKKMQSHPSHLSYPVNFFVFILPILPRSDPAYPVFVHPVYLEKARGCALS
jgi:hypothetical protein